MKALEVCEEVIAERGRQEKRWGEQNHPDGTGPGVLERLSYRCTSAEGAKGACERAFKYGRGTYTHILYEEVAEAFEETDPVRLREELVQVAAVAVAWIEKIDRDLARAGGA